MQVHFNDGDSDNSLLGSDRKSTAHTKLFGVQVTHKLDGFNLTGGYDHSTANELVPDLVSGSEPQVTDSSANAFNVGASHKLPLQGAFEVFYNRNDMNSTYNGGDYNGTVDTVGAGANFAPLKKLNVSVNTQYTDNLSGSLYQPLVASGAAIPASELKLCDKLIYGNRPANLLHRQFRTESEPGCDRNPQEQMIMGASFSGNSFSQMVNYGRPVLGGFMNATASISETIVEVAQDPTTIGTYENVSYTRGIAGWEVVHVRQLFEEHGDRAAGIYHLRVRV